MAVDISQRVTSTASLGDGQQTSLGGECQSLAEITRSYTMLHRSIVTHAQAREGA